MVNRVRCLYLLRCTGKLSELLLVGHCLHVLRDCGNHCGFCFGYWPCLQHRGTFVRISCSWIHGILIMTLDRWLSGRGPGLLDLGSQLPGLPKASLSTSRRGWFHPFVHGDCTWFFNSMFVCACAIADLETDCMDFLFRIEPPSLAPWLHRFICPQQRTARIVPKQSTPGAQRVRQPPGNDLDRSNASHVYIGSTQWLRNLVARVRLPGRSRRV